MARSVSNRVPKPITVDFETFGIKARPDYPPKPVGVSIKLPGKKARYYAWGHPTGNNCTEAEGLRALKAVWNHPDGLLFQNGKFDVDVAETHLGLPQPKWQDIHDTLFLLYLDDPHQKTFSLKPSADRLLGMKPEERDAVKDWLLENQPLLETQGIKISAAPKSEHYWGAYIAYAPGDLVGKYADGDTIRTEKLFQLLYGKTVKRGMLEAYNRERELMPILLEIERSGVHVDVKRLKADVKLYTDTRMKIDVWLRRKFKVTEDVNLDSGAQLIDAMINAKVVDPDKLQQTKGSGKNGKIVYKTDKESLSAAIIDPQLTAILAYRTQMNTCVGTFMSPWLNTALRSGGIIFTTWNQTKSTESGDSVGTKTGRLSSTPNFQNIPKEFKPLFKHEEPDAKKAKKLPKAPFDLPPLPQVRGYIVPPKGYKLIDRDYSQQELRILGHFENGVLMEAYNNNPWLDVHDFATTLLQRDYNLFPERTHDEARKPVKNTGFGLIYGMGVGKLALKSSIDVVTAKKVKDAYLTIFPGLKDLYREMKVRAKANEPIRTWGSREYYCEPPRMVDGRMMTFDYKMLNVLIQGSAADCTKQAVINYWHTKPTSHQLLLTVHDEMLVAVPDGEEVEGMEVLRAAMESVTFDVPMLSDGKVSATNWATLETFDTKGTITWKPKGRRKK